MEGRTAVRELLEWLLANKGDTDGFKDSDALLSSGRLASIDVLEIVLFLEQNYHIDFAANGFDQNRFESVDEILALIGEQGARVESANP